MEGYLYYKVWRDICKEYPDKEVIVPLRFIRDRIDYHRNDIIDRFALRTAYECLRLQMTKRGILENHGKRKWKRLKDAPPKKRKRYTTCKNIY